MLDGTVQIRDKGTPQGGVISPLLANLFLHYAFDIWMKREFPVVRFERYADDIVIHCKSHAQAIMLLGRLRKRLAECKLEMSPAKTGKERGNILKSASTFWATHSGQESRSRKGENFR
nr:reverse transcriptase domain-containing protein [Xenorhabdus hominickii]